MQQFLLNEKVITQLHMQPVNLKQRTKFAKKYDLPTKTSPFIAQSKLIHNLLERQRKILTEPQSNQLPCQQNSRKTKNLLSTLRFQNPSHNQHQDSSPKVIKQNYFTARGIKKQATKQKQSKKLMPRTCSLVTVMKPNQNYVAPYDVNPDLRFKRNPQCFFSPKITKNTEKKMKFTHLSTGKQNMNASDGFKKHQQTMKTLSIKEMVDKEMQELLKKRKANCLTAPQKHISKVNSKQNQFGVEPTIFQADICKLQGKIYNEMRENKQKLIRRNKQRVGINIEKNRPFGESELNKNTGKILKKYHCDSLAYFEKFIPHE